MKYPFVKFGDKMRNRRISEKRHIKRKRTEFFKSVLIFMLTGLLCFQTAMLIKTRSLSGMLFHRSSEAEMILNDEDVINLYFEYTAPEYIMVNRDGNRDVFLSDSEYYQKAQLLLQEINRNVFMPDTNAEPAEDGIFDRLTEIDSVYISYPYRRYPKYSAQFLNNTQESLSAYISYYTKVILVPETAEEAEKITVYIKDEKTGKAVKIITPVASSELVKYMNEIKGLNKKDYSFAHELNLGTAKASANATLSAGTEVDGDILIPLKNLSFPEISVLSPLELGQNPTESGVSPAAEEIMRAFGFTPSGARRYSDNSGVLVCVDEKATLKLYPGGVIEYSSVNRQSGLNLTGSSRLTGDNSYFLSFTGVSRIINSVIPLAGNSEKSFKIRLTDLQSESVEVSEYKFMFDYYLNGIRVSNLPYHGIEATTVEGRLTSMRIDLKRFESSYNEQTVEVLVSAIDMFCLDKKGTSPVTVSDAYLAYPVKDKLEGLSAGWIIY